MQDILFPLFDVHVTLLEQLSNML